MSNIFRFDDRGRLVEEWVRTDYRSFCANSELRNGRPATRAVLERSPSCIDLGVHAPRE